MINLQTQFESSKAGSFKIRALDFFNLRKSVVAKRPDFCKFWLRESGVSLKLTQITPLEALPATEKTLAAFLRSDGEAASDLIRTLSDDQFFELVILVRKNDFASYVYDRLIDMRLLELVPLEYREQIRRSAGQVSANKRACDAVFSKLLSRLASFEDCIIWIKGAATSRTLYRGHNLRISGDFDLVVAKDQAANLLRQLEAENFRPMKIPAMCNQLGVGPTNEPEDLMLSPHLSLTASSVAAYDRHDCPFVDIKFCPFDRGLQMVELERFFSDAIVLEHDGRKILVPSLVDQMMICLDTLAKDRFDNWKTLLDIHLLSNEFNASPPLWQTLVVCCSRESIEAPAWAGLSMARDRFKTVIPDSVLQQLKPNQSLLSRLTAFTASYYFVWNATSLPMLVMNAAISTDRRRKFSVLIESFFPSLDFIRNYYNGGKTSGTGTTILLFVLHWAVMLLPGGLVRRSFGKLIWETDIQGDST